MTSERRGEEGELTVARLQIGARLIDAGHFRAQSALASNPIQEAPLVSLSPSLLVSSRLSSLAVRRGTE